MKVLVTGGRGQLGRALKVALREHQAIILGRDELDVADQEKVAHVVASQRPDVVINAAAFTDVDGCELDPARAESVNHLGAVHVGEAAIRAQSHLIQISTDFVFDGDAGRPYSEEDVPNPIQVYGRTKLAAEKELLNRPGRVSVVRTSWLHDLDRPGGFVAAILLAADLGRPFDVVSDQAGSPTATDWLAKSIVEIAEHRMLGLVHRTEDRSLSRSEFAREVLAKAGRDPGLVRDGLTTDRPPRPAARPANSSLVTVRPTEHRAPAGTAEGCEC